MRGRARTSHLVGADAHAPRDPLVHPRRSHDVP